jgi:hypothetical protein
LLLGRLNGSGCGRRGRRGSLLDGGRRNGCCGRGLLDRLRAGARPRTRAGHRRALARSGRARGRTALRSRALGGRLRRRAGRGGRGRLLTGGLRSRARPGLGRAAGTAALDVCVPQPAGHRRLHGGGRGLDVLTLFGELVENFLARDAELLRELVHSGLACHCSPRLGRPGGKSPLDLVLSSRDHVFSFTADS